MPTHEEMALWRFAFLAAIVLLFVTVCWTVVALRRVIHRFRAARRLRTTHEAAADFVLQTTAILWRQGTLYSESASSWRNRHFRAHHRSRAVFCTQGTRRSQLGAYVQKTF